MRYCADTWFITENVENVFLIFQEKPLAFP